MKKNLLTTCGLCAVAILLFLNLLTAFFQPGNVFAQKEDTIGRYQISAWASPSKGSIQFAGYYVLDTATGKMVDKHSERLGVER
jgi:hypothetical protein